MVLPCLEHGGYSVQEQVHVGDRPSGKRHVVDVVAGKDDRQWLVSLKWQQSNGTAEQKIPYEVICLVDCLQRHGDRFAGAFLVLGGSGWTLRDYYVGGGLHDAIHDAGRVEILGLEDFVGKANQGTL